MGNLLVLDRGLIIALPGLAFILILGVSLSHTKIILLLDLAYFTAFYRQYLNLRLLSSYQQTIPIIIVSVDLTLHYLWTSLLLIS